MHLGVFFQCKASVTKLICFNLMALCPHVFYHQVESHCSVKLVQSRSTLDRGSVKTGSDETRFTLYHSDGRVWIWRQPREHLLPECIVPTIKFGAYEIMICWYFSCIVLEPLVPIYGILNTDAYCTILDDNVLSTLWLLYGLYHVTSRMETPGIILRGP